MGKPTVSVRYDRVRYIRGYNGKDNEVYGYKTIKIVTITEPGASGGSRNRSGAASNSVKHYSRGKGNNSASNNERHADFTQIIYHSKAGTLTLFGKENRRKKRFDLFYRDFRSNNSQGTNGDSGTYDRTLTSRIDQAVENATIALATGPISDGYRDAPGLSPENQLGTFGLVTSLTFGTLAYGGVIPGGPALAIGTLIGVGIYGIGLYDNDGPISGTGGDGQNGVDSPSTQADHIHGGNVTVDCCGPYDDNGTSPSLPTDDEHDSSDHNHDGNQPGGSDPELDSR